MHTVAPSHAVLLARNPRPVDRRSGCDAALRQAFADKGLHTAGMSQVHYLGRSKKTKITSLDIAHRAGVSQATVSRVLRGSPLVNAETRRRVEDAVRELNYKVDRHASSLRTQRSGTLALLLFEDPTPDESHINPFFLSMVGSITRACAREGQD